MKDKYIGKVGTKERRRIRNMKLRMDLWQMIKSARLERNLTQEELGQLVGVQKSQISKLESSANNAKIDTIIKVFKALNAEINFNVKIEDVLWNLLKLLLSDSRECDINPLSHNVIHSNSQIVYDECLSIRSNRSVALPHNRFTFHF